MNLGQFLCKARTPSADGPPDGPGASACMEPQVALLRQTRSENLTPATCQPGEQMLTRIGELVRRVMAWRRRRRGRQAANLL